MVFPPVEPPRTPWLLDTARADPGDDLVAAGADLEPGTLLAAYRLGLFPMGLGAHGSGRDGLVVARPARRPPGRRAAGQPLAAQGAATASRCGSTPRSTRSSRAAPTPRARAGGSPPRSRGAYGRLHALGWAHSVETWQDGELVGGLYGVSIGGLFAGESMFHAARDASKVALVGLVERFHADGDPRRLVDVQWATDHLRRLGAQEWPREDVPRPARRGAAARPQVELSA